MEQQMQIQNPSGSSSSSKADRKTIEKNRRNHMKSLFTQLTSLVPHHSREVLSLPDQLEQATSYIKKLQIKLERMRERRVNLTNAGSTVKPDGGATAAERRINNKKPEIEIHEIGSVIEVIMITGLLDYQLMFTEAIRVLHEEGAEVLKATYTIKDNTVFHTIHSKIAEFELHYGATRRISEKLKKIAYDDK